MSEQLSTSLTISPVYAVRASAARGSGGQQSPAGTSMALGHLSRREREILSMLMMRWTDREIADELCISYRTVTTHVSNIFDKLGVNSRREAVAVAMHAEDVAR